MYGVASRQLVELVREAVLEKGAAEEALAGWFLQEDAHAQKASPQGKQDRRRDPATIALGGLRRFRNAVGAVGHPEQDAVIGRLATDIAVEENVEETLNFLQRLVQEIEVRVQGKTG
jgi:hypothetical protein